MNIEEEYKKFKSLPRTYMAQVASAGTAGIPVVCELLDTYPEDSELCKYITDEFDTDIALIINNNISNINTRIKLIKLAYLSDNDLISSGVSKLSMYYNNNYNAPSKFFPITSHLELVLDAVHQYKKATSEEKNTFWYCTDILNFETILKDIAIATPVIKNEYDLTPLLLFYAYADQIKTSRSIEMPTGSTLANMYDHLDVIAEHLYGQNYKSVIETGRLLGVLDSQDYWVSSLKTELKNQKTYDSVTFSESI